MNFHRVEFRPHREMFSSGTNPIMLLRNLAALGTVSVCQLHADRYRHLAEVLCGDKAGVQSAEAGEGRGESRVGDRTLVWERGDTFVAPPWHWITHDNPTGVPACLFQSTDYLQASREHRRMLAEAEPLWKKYDALLSVVFGPAPRLDAHSPLNFWRRPNANPMANILGGPALALCAAFSAQGLPIGMQIMARPFGETTVLRLGHAFEGASGLRRQPCHSQRRCPDRDDADARVCHARVLSDGSNRPCDRASPGGPD